MNSGKNIILWISLIFMLVLAYDLFDGGISSSSRSRYAFSDFLSRVDDGQVQSVIIQGRNIEGTFADQTKFSTYAPDYPGLIDKLKANGVVIDAVPNDNKMNSFFAILLSWFPILLLIGVWIFFMRQMQGGGGKAMGFGKSKAKLISEKDTKITFNDVAGIDEAKEELEEIVSFLKDPAKFQALGGKIPRGCLLIGSPGTGKTLLAKAIAGEAKVPFFTISGSDFVEMFVGVGASRVRDLFEQGKKNAPCIVFIDEIDAVGRHRGIGLGGGNDEREQTLNQLLVEMDGFEENQSVIVIAATNRPDVLDPALLRPGRFDRQIVVPLPDIKGREKILAVHAARVKTSSDVDLKIIARGTPGFSGADLANLVNEAALYAARRNQKIVTHLDFEVARDKVMMGAERKSMVISDTEKKLTAYHEAGHAIVALHMKASDPIHKATIIPRGRALGMVMRLPNEDKLSLTREKAIADITVAMGGRVAEAIIFGYDKITSGASSDIKQATKMARAMVTEWGMSDKIGPLFHGAESSDMYLGGGHSNEASRSEDTAKLIDEEIKKIVQDSYERATNILTTNIDQLHKISEALLEYETISGDEINDLLAGKKIRSDDSNKEDNNDVPNSEAVVNNFNSGPQEA